MKHILACIAALATGIAALSPAAARDLSFRHLEAQQPRDPLVSNFTVYTVAHETPAGDLQPALAALRKAIPAGTPLADAQATLTRAGARCATATQGMVCTYHGLQTVDQYLDETHWQAALTTVDGKVTGLSLTRHWQRHI